MEKEKSGKSTISKIVMILGLLLVVAGFCLFFFTDNNKPENNDEDKPNEENTEKEPVLVEDVEYSGKGCFNSNCSITFVKDRNYTLNTDRNGYDSWIFTDDYNGYLKIDVNYVEKNGNYEVVDYKVMSRITGEDITSIKTENELREKLGLYVEGTYTEQLKLSAIVTVGIDTPSDESYDPNIEYDNNLELKLTDAKDIDYNMSYRFKASDNVVVSDDFTNVVIDGQTYTEGNSYTFTFNVSKDETFDYYVYEITNIK